MSVDDAFQGMLRSLAALVWLFIVYLASSKRMQTYRIDGFITAATLALVLVVVAIGGFLATFHVVPGDWIRVAYTATAATAFGAGIIMLTH